MSRVSITNVSASTPSGLLIGGKWVKGNGEKLESVNPDTEEVIATVRQQVTRHRRPTCNVAC